MVKEIQLFIRRLFEIFLRKGSGFILLGLLFLLTLFFIYNIEDEQKKICLRYPWPTVVVDLARAGGKPATLVFVGDVMLDRGVEYQIQKEGEGSYKWPFFKIAGYLKKSDFLFGNLESVVSDRGTRVGSIYSFRADPKAIKGLVYAGFDVVSVANNHIFDYGRVAMEDSFKRLRAAGIEYIGGGFSEKEAHSPVIKKIGKTRIAFLAYTNLGSKYWEAGENQSGIAWLDDRITKDIGRAKKKADIVVVSMHFGEEYRRQPTEEQKYFARLAIDSGADLVIGHHPHVVEPVERYKRGYIAYSLGNFVFDQGFSEQTMEGLVLEVLVKNGKIKKVTSRDIKINRFFQPELANQN